MLGVLWPSTLIASASSMPEARRFTRLTDGYGKKELANHWAATALHVVHYSLLRPRKTAGHASDAARGNGSHPDGPRAGYAATTAHSMGTSESWGG